MSRTQNDGDIESDITPSPRSPLLDNGSDSQDVVSSNPLRDIRTILFSAYINILLIFLPFALISGAFEWSPTIVFATNFFALMPLASLLSFATEELSKKVGQGIGGLLNVTFGNATELIVGIVALRDGQVRLIQTTMLGSILSSLLFVSQSFKGC
jgi:Ca2+/H+ antiporter